MPNNIRLTGSAYEKFVKSPRLGKIGSIDLNDNESRYQATDTITYNQQKVFSYGNRLLVLTVSDNNDYNDHDVTNQSYHKVELRLLNNFGFSDSVKDTVYADITYLFSGDKVNDIDCIINESLDNMYIFAEKGSMCYKINLSPNQFGQRLAEFKIGYANKTFTELVTSVDSYAERNSDEWYYTHIPFRLRPKLSKNILYFNYYQYIISINVNTDQMKIELVAPWIIGACNIYWISNTEYKFYFSLEPYTYKEDVSAYLVRSDVGWKRIDANSFNEAFKWEGDDASIDKTYTYNRTDIMDRVFNNLVNKELDTQIKYTTSDKDPNVRIISINWDNNQDYFTITDNHQYREPIINDTNDRFNLDRNVLHYNPNDIYLGIGSNYSVRETIPTKHNVDTNRDHGIHVDENPPEEDTTPSSLGYLFRFDNLRNSVKNTLIGVDELFPNDTELQTINELYIDEDNNTLIVSQFNGFVTRYTISNGNINKSSGQVLLNVPGVIEKISISNDMVICMHDINNITIWNDTFNKVETLTLDGEPLDFNNNPYMIFTYQNNRHINVYKLSDIPNLSIDYAIVEKSSKYKDGDLPTYYLNIRAKVGSDYMSSNIQDGNKYDVTFWYRNLPNVLSDSFPSSNVYKNFYLQLRDIRNILNERQFELDKDKIYYAVSSKAADMSISNDGTDTKVPPIYKIWNKDAYFYHGKIFFRLRFLLDTEYSLKITVDDKKIAIINKDSEKSLYDSNRYTSLNDCNTIFFNGVHYDQLWNKFSWFNINDIEYSPNKEFKYELYYNGNKIASYSQSIDISFNTPTDTNLKDNSIPLYTKFLEADGAIINLEKQFISDLEHNKSDGLDGKDFLLHKSLSNTAFKYEFNGNSVPINKEEYIGDYVNDESQYGYYDFTVPYDSKNEKMNSRVSDIYVNGKRLYRYAFRQMDDLQGKLETFVPVRRVKDIIAISDNQLREDDKIILTATKSHLYQSERLIYKYEITNEYENETQMANSVGISIPANISQSLSANDIRIYIMLKDDVFYHRLNPSHYMIEIDRDYGYARVYLYGVNWLLPGDQIVLVSNK